MRQTVAHAQRQLSQVPDLAPTAALDAALLVQGILHLTRAELYTGSARQLSASEQAHVQTALRRRLAGEPMQYILGTQEFFGLPLAVFPGVLIPRPETELLVEAVLQHMPKDRQTTLADVGTGSGAIAIALAVHLPEAHVIALDISPDALRVATLNAAAHGVQDRISFLLSDLLRDLPRQELDAVASNPPYIPLTEKSSLHRQVRDFEPHLALFAPADQVDPTAETEQQQIAAKDGLSLYRRLIPQAGKALKPGGLLAMEFGAGQQAGMADLLRDWDAVHFLNDLQNIPRTALARMPGGHWPR